MNIFHKVALQGLKKNRTRTLVTVIGVMLSATLFTTVAAFGTSLLQYLLNGSIAKYGSWHVNFVDVDSDFVRDRMEDSQVTGAAVFENIGYALLDGAKSAEKPYLFLAGLPKEALFPKEAESPKETLFPKEAESSEEALFPNEASEQLPVTLISGRFPENDREVIIPNHVSIKAGVRIPTGEPLSLLVGNREKNGSILNQHDPYTEEEALGKVEEKTYEVVGTYERAGFEEHDSPGYTVITRAEPCDGTGRYSLFLTLKEPRKVNAYVSEFAGSAPFVLNEDVLRFYGVSDNALLRGIMLGALGTLAAIIMIGSVFLIYNSFHISLNERIHQFGILMSVGATSGQLRNSVLFEGLCIGILGIPFGVVAGIGCVALALPVVADNFAIMSTSSVALELSVSVPALGLAAAVSLITILISAYIPARKAARVPVMECIRQTGEIRLETKRRGKASRFGSGSFRLASRLLGLEGMLALKNFRRNKRRYRSVVLSLTLSVVLFVTGSAFGSALKGIAKELTVEADGDISFYAQDMPEEELLMFHDRLKNVDGVRKSTWQVNQLFPCTVRGIPDDFAGGLIQEAEKEGAADVAVAADVAGAEGAADAADAGAEPGAPLFVQFLEDAIYFDFIESLGFAREEFEGAEGKVLALALDTSEHEVFFTGREAEFTLSDPETGQAKTVRAAMVDNYPLDMLPFDSMPRYLYLMLVPWSEKGAFAGLGGESKSGLTFWSDTPAQTMALIQSEIIEAGITRDYTLINLSSALDLFRSLTFVVDVFTYSFVVMISLIGVANVFNTISTNIRIRRRELAMLRSVGMSERGFRRMMNFECFFYGLRTLGFGVPIAGVLSWLIYRIMAASEEMEGFAWHFPWGSLTIAVLGVFCIVSVTMLYATDKIRKENIIDGLRDDMA